MKLAQSHVYLKACVQVAQVDPLQVLGLGAADGDGGVALHEFCQEQEHLPGAMLPHRRYILHMFLAWKLVTVKDK